LADALESHGLYVEKQSNPESIHMTIMPNHIGKMQDIMKMITLCLEEVMANPGLYELGSKAVYGMMAKIPDEAITEDFVVHYMDKIYKLK
jgi:sphinganine-1-phosphate aldolase